MILSSQTHEFIEEHGNDEIFELIQEEKDRKPASSLKKPNLNETEEGLE